MNAPTSRCGFDDDPEPYFCKRGLVQMRVPEDFPLCAVFIGTRINNVFQPRATGFVASFVEDGYHFTHLVTAEHVVSGMMQKNERMFLRANFTNGGAGEYELDTDKWYFHPDEHAQTDVSICPFILNWTGIDGRVVTLDHKAVRLSGVDSMDLFPEGMAEMVFGLAKKYVLL